MKQRVSVMIGDTPNEKKEIASMTLVVNEGESRYELDLSGTAMLKISRAVPDLAQDLLTIAACVYGSDKALSRRTADDNWTREIDLEVPVEHSDKWNLVQSELSESISFLTGDLWQISFRKGESRLIQKKQTKRRKRYNTASGDAVCLFSGGLDSFIGAIDWLETNPDKSLLLVGHYDRHVTGVKGDQSSLEERCILKYGTRFCLAQTRVGLDPAGEDTNFRSRSFLFIALGCYFGELIGKGKPVYIPENGSIALNFPLTASRHGSCSTRTVHPQFIDSLNGVLRKVGISNPVSNPYELKTKGEMVRECRNSNFLEEFYDLTRSCAKAGHTVHWANNKARSCGNCVPCLFRRASLHAGGWDNECYGNQFETIGSHADIPKDLRALISFLRTARSDLEILSGLASNGRFPSTKSHDYVDLVKRMRAEVLELLRDKGSDYIRSLLPSC